MLFFFFISQVKLNHLLSSQYLANEMHESAVNAASRHVGEVSIAQHVHHIKQFPLPFNKVF